jgi:hypothetical protein
MWPVPPVCPGDDPAISNDDVLVRRVPVAPNMLSDDAEVRPTTAAFKYDSDGVDNGVSVFREALLAENGLVLGRVRRASDDHLYGLHAGAARSGGLGSRPSPWPQYVPDPENEIYVAHALLVCAPATAASRKTREKLLRALVKSGALFVC